METKWRFLNKTPEFNIDTIRENFENCIDIDHEDDRIKWLKKQLSYINVPPSKRIFSNSWCLTFAFDLFIKGAKSYEFCREFMFLPSPRHLRRISAFLKPSATSDVENKIYLGQQINNLENYEKVVALKFDEVSLTPALNFQGEQVFGFAENSENQILADSCQAFMIESLFGKYQEIVGLIPVYNLNGTSLEKYLIDQIDLLQEIGFTVVAITSDNASKNRAVFENLGIRNKTFDSQIKKKYNLYTFKYSEKQIIHLFFDAPHIFKCVRNNWTKQKNSARTFEYPQNSIFNGQHASFNVIVDLYESEKNNTVKLAPKLSKRAVNPGGWDKQQVQPALAIFDPTTSAGLLQIVENYPNDIAYSTANFLKAFNDIWKILNIKTPFKHVYKNDPISKPFSDPEDSRLTELESFTKWLEDWLDSDFDGKLSKETFHSLILTLKSLKSFIDLY